MAVRIATTAVGRVFTHVLPPVLWAALIFVLSSRSTLPTPSVSGFDKVAHFGAYFVLAVLTSRALHLRWRGTTAAVITFVLGVAYGISDEVHQSFVPGREPDLADLVADGFGAAAGAVFWYAVIRYLGQRNPT